MAGGKEGRDTRREESGGMWQKEDGGGGRHVRGKQVMVSQEERMTISMRMPETHDIEESARDAKTTREVINDLQE